MGKRILLTTTGSLGDLHPFMAIGLGLRSRGHAVTLATSNFYRPKIEQAGLAFAPMGPHFDLVDSEMMRRILNRNNGPEYLVRKIMYPSIPTAFTEVMEALSQADAIVTHPITFGAQIAAEKSGLPWTSTVTAPMSICSRFDPPVFAPYPLAAKLRALGPTVNGLILKLAYAVTKSWMGPVTRFRKSQGLPPGRDPLFAGQHSPQCVIALFSRLMAAPQPDWPPQASVTGFPFYDQAEHGRGLDPELERFLDSGPPPVVFTLGSSAVFEAGSFYRESLGAIKKLGCRAVLLTGDNELREPLPAGTAMFPYAPFSTIFPRALVVVHQGGIGTCGQALASGRPMLVMPYGFDQPDNAARLERLGIARSISRSRYSASKAAEELDLLRSDPAYARRAAEAAKIVREEDGVRFACDAIEGVLKA